MKYYLIQTIQELGSAIIADPNSCISVCYFDLL